MNIYSETIKIVKKLENTDLILKTGERVNIVYELKQKPRSGYAVRVDKYELNLPKQSIFDHILMMAHFSDISLKCFSLDYNKIALSLLCPYHDIAESLMADVPDFTSRELAGSTYLTKDKKITQENKVIEIISERLPEELRREYEMAVAFMRAKDPLLAFFKMLDKMEPIISIWRNIYFFKNLFEIEKYIVAMADFFDNPHIVGFAINSDFRELAEFFQNKDNARNYYYKGAVVFNDFKTMEIGTFLKQLVEGKNIHCVS